MELTYRQRMDDAHQRLRQALAPQTQQQHAIVDWLRMWDLPTLETLALLVEQSAATRARAHGMRVAQFCEQNFDPAMSAPPDVLATLAHIATGGDDDDGVQPDPATVQDAHQRAREVAAAYDRGFAEGVEHAAQQGRKP